MQCLREAQLNLEGCHEAASSGYIMMYSRSETGEDLDSSPYLCFNEDLFPHRRRCDLGFDLNTSMLHSVFECGVNYCYFNYAHTTVQM